MKELFTRFIGVAGFLVLMAVATADDSAQVGGSRAAGMGGAGIALPIDIVNNQRLNVAFLGWGKNKHYSLAYPEAGARTTGINFSDLHNVFSSSNSSGVSNSSVTNLYNEFSTHNVEASADAGLGLVIANLAINATGAADVASIPNAALQTGGALAAGARLDAYGYGFYQLDAGVGLPLTVSDGSLAVGARIKTVKAYYAHKVATETGGTVTVDNGAEFGSSTDDTMSKTGVGGDLGLLYSPKLVDMPKTLDHLYVAATMTNVVVPSVGFTRTLPNSNTATEDYNPFARTTTVGAGAEVGKNLLLAADVYDLFGNASGKELRLGAELKLGSLLAVRGGYNSQYGFTVGASVFGFNLAYSAKEPLSITTGLKF